VDIWSDVACPWCYIGKSRLEAALREFEHRDEVEIRYHSFELAPDAPTSGPGEHGQLLAAKYGLSPAEAQQALDRVRSAAAGDGLELRFDLARSGPTFDAHRLLHLAAARGVQAAAKERLMRAHFSEGADVADHDTLVRLGREAGLDEAELRTVLGSRAYADEVRADEAQARQLGISGVPFFVVDGKYGVSGAQPVEVFAQLLARVWSERPPVTVVSGPDQGEACALDGGAC